MEQVELLAVNCTRNLSTFDLMGIISDGIKFIWRKVYYGSKEFVLNPLRLYIFYCALQFVVCRYKNSIYPF